MPQSKDKLAAKRNGSKPSVAGRGAPVARSEQPSTKKGHPDKFLQAPSLAEAMQWMSETAKELVTGMLEEGWFELLQAPGAVTMDATGVAAANPDKQMTTNDILAAIVEVSQWVIPSKDGAFYLRIMTPVGWTVDEKGEPVEIVIFMSPARSGTEGSQA